MKIYTISEPLLYLDFDGVLHPDAAYRTKYGITLKNYPGHTLFENSELLVDALAPYPEVKIVLSTSWVKELGFNNARKRLSHELARRVIGATWHTRMDARQWEYLSRYQQVQQHATRHSVANWLALDDDTDDWNPMALSHVVQCDTKFGLNTLQNLQQLKSWLSQQYQG